MKRRLTWSLAAYESFDSNSDTVCKRTAHPESICTESMLLIRVGRCPRGARRLAEDGVVEVPGAAAASSASRTFDPVFVVVVNQNETEQSM